MTTHRIKVARSPLYWIVGILQGISVTFAPLFLYWSARRHFFHDSEWILPPLCFGVILLVGFFYIRLGHDVIRELQKVPHR